MFKNFFLKQKQKKAVHHAHKFLTRTVGSLMTPYVVTMRPDTSVIQAATRMVAQNISCIVVVSPDDAHDVKGIVTERDFIKKVPGSPSALKKKVSDIMTGKIVAVSLSDTLHNAYRLMKSHGFRKLIVKEDGRLVGIITQTDIVSYGLKTMNIFFSSQPLVSDWMTKNITSIRPNASFIDAKNLMIKKDIGALLVKGATYEGIFTEYDVVAQFYDQGGLLHIRSPKHIMHEHIRCIDSDTTIMFANRVMSEKKVRRLLTVQNDKVVGIITQTDVAEAIFSSAEEMTKKNFSPKQFFHLSKKPISVTYVSENLKVYGLS